jgi:predicted ATP-grasp superfamily ATP-dependent carboligase
MRPERLIVLGSSVTALAMVRSAHAQGLACEVVDVEAGVAFATRLATCDCRAGTTRSDALSAATARHAGRGAWLVATTDEWLRVVGVQRAALDAAFDRVLHPSGEVLDICLNKRRFAQFCDEHGLPAPRSFDAQADPGTMRYPVLLRPAATLHSRPVPGLAKAQEADTPAALSAALATYAAAGVAPVITASLLGRPLEQYSVGISRHDGRTLAVVARKVRPLPRACRVGTLVETADAPDVEALARTAAERLHYEGIAEVEILRTRDDGALHLIEVNARPWVQFGIGAAAGRDLLRFQLDGSEPAGRMRHVRWISFPDDLWLCMNREHGLVRRGEVSWLGWAVSVLGARAYARWSLRDPGPFMHGLRELVGPRIARLRRRRAVRA